MHIKIGEHCVGMSADVQNAAQRWDAERGHLPRAPRITGLDDNIPTSG